MQEKFKDYSNVNVETIQDIFMTTDIKSLFEDLFPHNIGSRFNKIEKLVNKIPAREVLKSCVHRLVAIRPQFKYVTFEKNSVDVIHPYAAIRVYLWTNTPYFKDNSWFSQQTAPQFVGEFGEKALDLPRNFRYDVLYELSSLEQNEETLESEGAEGAEDTKETEDTITKVIKAFEGNIQGLTFDDLITLEQRVKQQIETAMLEHKTKIIIELEVPRHREQASIVGDFTVYIGDKEIKYGDLDHTLDLANNSEIKIVL